MNRLTSRRVKRVLIAAAVDLCLLGVFLVLFAYFHHVRVNTLAPTSVASPTATPAAAPAATPAQNDAPQDAAAASPAPGDDASATIEAGTGLLGGKYAERFTTGEIESTETSYKSANVSIDVEKVELDGPITYYVADIYIKDLTSFATAVAYDYADQNESSRKNVMSTLQMAELSNALVAISGDNFTFRKEGLIAVRNGAEWYYNLPLAQDICVLYYDGTMETYARKEAGKALLEEIYARSPYQIWSFGPELLVDGQPQTTYAGSKANPLAAVGYYEPGHYCFVLVDGRQKGYSLGMSQKQLAEVFYEMGCTTAYNLDGGDTAVMTFGAAWMSRPENQDPREVSDILYIREPD